MSLSTLVWSIPDRVMSVVSKVAVIWTANRRPIIIGTVITTIGACSLVFLYYSQRKLPLGGLTVDSDKGTTTVEIPKGGSLIATDAQGKVVDVKEDADVKKPTEKLETHTVPFAKMETTSPRTVTPTGDVSRSSSTPIGTPSKATSTVSEFYSAHGSTSMPVSSQYSSQENASFYSARTRPDSSHSLAGGGVATEDEMLPEADDFDHAANEYISSERFHLLESDLSREIVTKTIHDIEAFPVPELTDKEANTMCGYMEALFELLSKSSPAQSAHHDTAFSLWSSVVKWFARVLAETEEHSKEMFLRSCLPQNMATQLAEICREAHNKDSFTCKIPQEDMLALISSFQVLLHAQILGTEASSPADVWISFMNTVHELWLAVLQPLDQLPKALPKRSESDLSVKTLSRKYAEGWYGSTEVQLATLRLISHFTDLLHGDVSCADMLTLREQIISAVFPVPQKNLRCLLSLALPRPESQRSGFQDSTDGELSARQELRVVALFILARLSEPLEEAEKGSLEHIHRGALLILGVNNVPSSVGILLKRAMLLHPQQGPQPSLHENWLRLLVNVIQCVLVCSGAGRVDLLVHKDKDTETDEEEHQREDTNAGEAYRMRSFLSVVLHSRADLQASAALLVTRGESREVKHLATRLVALLESLPDL